jgi:hypothetical protein
MVGGVIPCEFSAEPGRPGDWLGDWGRQKARPWCGRALVVLRSGQPVAWSMRYTVLRLTPTTRPISSAVSSPAACRDLTVAAWWAV